MQHALAFDWETHLIGGNDRQVCQCGKVHGQFPPAVCMSFARDDGSSGVVLKDEGLAMLAEGLDDPDCHLVGHETAFDVLVSVANSNDPAGWLKAWVGAYDAGRVHDTAVRQKLIDLANNRYRWHRHANGFATRIDYDLGTTSRRNGGPQLNKQDEWRKQYALLDGIPLAEWPSEAVDYSVLDAVATGVSYENQSEWRTNTDILARWSGFQTWPDNDEPDALADEHAQTCHALWLKAMSGHGIRTDFDAIKKYEHRARLAYDSLAIEAFAYGFLRREYWRDLKRLRELGHPMKGNRPWAELKAGMDLDDPEAIAAWEELDAARLVRSRYVRQTKAVQSVMLDVCEARGLPVPRTDGWEKAERQGRTPDYDEYVAIDSDACRISEDERLTAYADLVHQAKILTSDVPQLLLGVHAPIHSHFESLLETGRISSASPNLTNRARGEKDRAGDRECFVPRQGYVLIDYDYPQLELFALAQVCKWTLGYSTLGDALNRGLDPHLDFAAAQLGITYEEAEARYEAGKTDGTHAVEDERQAAKGYNFGRPGGLGTKTFVGYAAKSYKVVKTREEWDRIFALGDAKWREMPAYFAFINSLETEDGYNVPQTWSGRLRAGATYCSACNSFYQGLGADVAKLAGWYLFKACYVPGADPELYGCRLVNFIHDQFLIEALEGRAAAAAKRVEFWCGKAAVDVLPDYGAMMASKAEAILACRWSKQAKRVENDNGDLIAWEDERLLG